MTIQNTIEGYRKRRNQMGPLVIGIAAILLVVIGIVIVVIALGGGKASGWNPFSTRTPTPTVTFTPTNTPVPTETPTITLTPTETATGTPSAPYKYVVQQGDTLYKLVQDKNLGTNGIVLILLLNPYNPNTKEGINPNTQVIYAGQTISLPYPGEPMPTPTPWPSDAPYNTPIQYLVLPGDSLGAIANKLRSTVEAIVAANKTLLVNGDKTILYPGWLLTVPVNLVTAVPTASSTLTATQPAAPTATPTQ